MLNFTLDTLQNKSIDLDEFSNFNNIGEIGINVVDYSNNTPANEFQTNFPLVSWLLNTPVSRQAQSAHDRGQLRPFKGQDGLFHVMTPVKYGTTSPVDTTGECCWVPFDLTKCMGEVPIHMLCLKDCYPVLQNLIYDKNRFQPNDMINYFQREGETYTQARERMARMSMAFFTAHNIILGTSQTETPVLKPFHGLMEIMEGADVIKIVGSNVIAAFDEIACRLSVLGTGNYAFAMHPVVYEGLKIAIQPGQNGLLPLGWSKDANGDVRFMGHPIIVDKDVTFDPDAGTGDIWMLEGGSLGAIMGTGLEPSERFTRETQSVTTNREEGCMTECKYYYNYGTVFAIDTNKLAVITDVPIASNCFGEGMNGLDFLMKPETIVPINI